eukprot:750700-Hanusia_phi.AAC.9
MRSISTAGEDTAPLPCRRNMLTALQILQLESKLKTTSSIIGEISLREQDTNQALSDLQANLARYNLEKQDLRGLLRQEVEFIDSAEEVVQNLVASEQSLVTATIDLYWRHTKLVKENKMLKNEAQAEKKIAARKLEMALKQIEELCNQIESQNDEHLKAVRTLKQQLHELEKTNYSLQKSVQEVEAKCFQLGSDLKHQTEESDSLKKKVEELTEQINNLDETLTSTQLQRDSMKEELKQIKEIRIKLEMKAADLMEDSAKMTMAAQQHQRDLTALKTLHQETLEKYNEEKTVNTVLKRELGREVALKSDLEKKLHDLNVELKRTSDCSSENKDLRMEISRLQNGNQETLSEIKYLQDLQEKSVQLSSFMISMYETFLSKMMEKEGKTIANLMVEKKDLLLTVKRVEEERDSLRDEIKRLNALPNLVGVGLELKEDIFQFADGRQERKVAVESLILGMSASNSNVILKGDELLEVNGQSVDDMHFSAIRASVCGASGSLVNLRFRRYEGSRNSSSKFHDYRVVLKRGSWGAEHAVVTAEVSLLIGSDDSYSPRRIKNCLLRSVGLEKVQQSYRNNRDRLDIVSSYKRFL